MKKKYSVAVVGATGLVGQKMIQVLTERGFPVSSLVPVASEKSVNKTILFNHEKIKIQLLEENVFDGVDIALFSAGKEISKKFAPIAAAKGAVVIDNSSAWRMDKDVPLVVPEVNAMEIHKHSGIIANPNCSTIQMVVVLAPLHLAYGIRRIVVSTYQSVSGSGTRAVRQLQDEIRGVKSKSPAFPHPIAFNCLPHIDEFEADGYTREEIKMIEETRKIMGLPRLAITATTVRIPVITGHSESVNVAFNKNFAVEEIRELLKSSPGVIVQDEPGKNIYPLPVNAEEKDAVFVGRIRRDLSQDNGLNLWIVSDNLRKGAATNAVQIAEALIREDQEQE